MPTGRAAGGPTPLSWISTAMSNRLNVRERVLTCQKCDLHAGCSSPVPFSGPTPSYVAVLGEAPGQKEDLDGRAFVGPAGELLRAALQAAGINDQSVFYVNCVSCWPRRTPTSAEINACSQNRIDQLELSGCAWVLALGNVALSTVRPDLRVSRARGHVFCPPDQPNYFVTFHPAAALRNANTEKAMRADLVTFAEMLLEEDVDDVHGWAKLASNDCVICGTDPEEMDDHDMWLRFDDMGASYCIACFERSPLRKGEINTERKLEKFQAKTGQLFQ